MPIVQQEVFGPVLIMQTFSSEAEAIATANDSEYGLSASVFSRDIDRPLRVALALEAGSIWVNDWARLHDQFEEGGFKSSGVGCMRGFAVLDDFLEYKFIRLVPGTTPAAGWVPARTPEHLKDASRDDQPRSVPTRTAFDWSRRASVTPTPSSESASFPLRFRPCWATRATGSDDRTDDLGAPGRRRTRD